MADDSLYGATQALQGDPSMERVTLRLDNGATMQFTGRQFAGGSWYDEESATLTRQTLYVTSANEQVYALTTARGGQRSRRAYRISVQDDLCTIHDGRQEMTIELPLLLLAVQALAGLDKQVSPAIDLAVVEDTLRAANC